MSEVKKQEGFSVIEVVVVIFIIALIAVIGWLVWDRQNTSNTQANSNNNSNSSNTQSVSAVEIKEWGVKLNTTHADELTYNVLNESGTLEFSNEAYDSIVTFKIKPELLTDKECSPGVNLYRLTGSPKDSENSIKIDNKYYTTFGAPGMCDNDADTDLKTGIISDIKVENLEAL